MWKKPVLQSYSGCSLLLVLQQWFNQNSFSHRGWTQAPVLIRRRSQNGWVDFFLGDAQETHCYSLLDGKAKVGLHFRTPDLEMVASMASPSPEIPDYLWRQLQRQYTKRLSVYSLINYHCRSLWHCCSSKSK